MKSRICRTSVQILTEVKRGITQLYDLRRNVVFITLVKSLKNIYIPVQEKNEVTLNDSRINVEI